MAMQGAGGVTGGSGLSNWQASLRFMDDDEEQDSDTDSKLSGSALVDSVMKRLRNKHSHYKDNSYMGGGDFQIDHTLREQDEENEGDSYSEERKGSLGDMQSSPGRYDNPPHMNNGYHDGGANHSPNLSRRQPGMASNSPRSQHRRNYENTHLSPNYYSGRKQEVLSPVPEFTSSGARVVEVSGPAHSQPWGVGKSRTRTDEYTRGFGKSAVGPSTRSMENISHGGSPGTRRRRNYEQTQIGVGGIAVGNGRPGYRDVRIPAPQTSGSELSSIHSRSQEILPHAAHFDHTHQLSGGGGYHDIHDGAQSDINVGSYRPAVRRSSVGSNSGTNLPSTVPPPASVHRSPYQPTQPPHLHSAPASQVTLSSSAPQRTWLGDHNHQVPGYDPARPPNQRRANYTRHEIPRDTSYSSNLHSEIGNGRFPDDPMDRSGSMPRSEFSGTHTKGGEPNLNDVVDFLSSEDPGLVSNAASYLQHLAYGDDNMKSKIRTYGAIPSLVSQLRSPETKVQISVLGALRNLSFGRANDENKLEIAGDHGLAEILLALKMSRVSEVRELLTSLLWNLSSCEDLKLRIIKSSIHDIVELALIPYTGWSLDAARDPLAKPRSVTWNLELRNITGTLRNISSAGEPSRVFMRASNGLVDSLIWLLKAGVQHKIAADEKTVENAACVLRNLSYRLENEIDPQEGAGDVLDREWEEEQRRDLYEVNQSFTKSSPGCLAFLTRSRGSSNRENARVQSPLVSRPTYSVDFANPDPSALPKRSKPVYGVALLWQPEIVYLYLALMEHYSAAVETVEAAAGAIQNITACNWKWAVYSRNVIRTSNGLRLLAELLNNGHDAVVKASAMALRNLAIDPRNKSTLGSQVIPSVIPRLPFGSNHLGISEETTVALLCCLMEVCSESTPNSRIFLESEGIPYLTRLSRSRQHTQKINFAAGKLCSILYECKDCKTALKREGWELSQFQRMVKENLNQFDFEQRISISRDYQGSRRKKRNKKSSSKKSKGRGNRDDEESIASGFRGEPVSATPSIMSSMSPSHVPQPRSLPPTVEEQFGDEPGYQLISKPKQPAPIIYQSIDDPDIKGTISSVPAPQPPPPRTETAASTTSGPLSTCGPLSTSGPLSATSQEEEEEPDPNATYASVDIEKKRASRRQKEREKKEKERKVVQQQQPEDADSWV